MKKAVWLMGIIVVLVIVGLLVVKHFTLLLDDKDKAIVVNESYQWEGDFSDKRKLSGAANNIFIGEIVEQVGNEQVEGKPYTLYSVRITQNIKGGFLDDIVVAQLGGYYKDAGKLYHLQIENESFLKQGKMYLFATTPHSEKEWQQMIPKYGSTLINNEEQKFKLIDEFKEAIKE
jgi:hypothetical protein